MGGATQPAGRAANRGFRLVGRHVWGVRGVWTVERTMSFRSILFAFLGAFLLGEAGAAKAPSQALIAFSIPAEPLADALNRLAQQSGLQILFPSGLGAQIRSQEVRGSLTVDGALHRLLINTGLRFEFINARTVTIYGDTPAGSGGDTLESTSSGSAIEG